MPPTSFVSFLPSFFLFAYTKEFVPRALRHFAFAGWVSGFLPHWQFAQELSGTQCITEKQTKTKKRE